jgi:hypothetical protein
MQEAVQRNEPDESLLVAGLAPAITLPAYAATTVFINELYYDNDGTDSGEAIEIAGPAGTDLTGWTVVLERLAQRVTRHDHAHIQQRVALTDGSEALQQQMQTHLPQHTLVLDIIHATEYLWDAVNGWPGDTHPDRQHWMGAG